MSSNPMSMQARLQNRSTSTAIGLTLRPGFTLIELLVVISIIVMLVAILLPALGSARVASQRTVSISNVRQITLAQHMYTNDFKGSFPFLKETGRHSVTNEPVHNRWGINWAKKFVNMGYLSSPSVYWSPGRAQSFATGISGDGERTEFVGQTRPTAYSYESVGYGMNSTIAGGREDDILLGTAPPPMRLGEARAPRASDMLLLAETWASSGINTTTPVGSLNGYYEVAGHRYSSTTTSRLFNYRGGIVRSYVDGRAHAMTSASQGGLLVSGRTDLVGNALYLPTHADEIAWDIRRIPSDTVMSGAYAGQWSLQHLNDRYYQAPWYLSWRASWNAGLRTTTP